jgi:hypothetical protein
MLNPLGNQEAEEDVQLSFTTTASDPETPPELLTFSLEPGAPSGTSITPEGIFTWTPTETQGPGMYTVTVIVTDNDTPPLEDDEVITITVSEINQTPILEPIENQIVDEGALSTFNSTASDQDIPMQILTFSLDPGAPQGAGITQDGVFTWTPEESQGPGVYSVTVRVADNGDPALEDSETITITVNEINTRRMQTMTSMLSRILLYLSQFWCIDKRSRADLP